MSILDDVINNHPKQIDENKPMTIVASDTNIEDLAKMLVDAKRRGSTRFSGRINGVEVWVSENSTQDSIERDYKAQLELLRKDVKNGMFAFRAGSGEVKTFQSRSEGTKSYEGKLIDIKERFDKKNPGNDEKVYGATGEDNKFISVGKGMTPEQVREEEAYLKTNPDTIKASVYKEAMAPGADVKEKIVDLAKNFKGLNLGDPSAVLSWLNEAQGFTSKMDRELVQEIIDKIEGAGYRENKNTGNIISLDNMSAEDVARWAVGRALGGLKQDGNIRPGISRIVGDLKKYAA